MGSCVVGSVVGSWGVGSWAEAVVVGAVIGRCLSRFPLGPAPASPPGTGVRFLPLVGCRGRGEAVPLPGATATPATTWPLPPPIPAEQHTHNISR